MRMDSSVMFDISGEAKPSNLPLKVLLFLVILAKFIMMSTAVGPPITSTSS